MRNKIKTDIVRRISALKKDFQINAEEIFGLETELTSINDAAIKAKIECMKIFEGLNFERATPLFLSLVKRGKKVVP